jgi:hypothetical protein
MIMGYGAGVAPLPNRTPVVALAQSLFLNGENGGFYRPADFSTLYQEYTGATPVTAIGQPVGLELDTSRGLWGDDLAVNGDFSDGLTGWFGTLSTETPPNAWYWDPQGARSPAGEAGSMVQGHPTPASHVRVRWTQTINSGSRARIRIRNLIDSADTLFTYVHGSGTFQRIVPCVAGGVSVRFLSEAADDVTISNFSVTEIDGNHQSTITATARPVLARQPAGGRRNRLRYSEPTVQQLHVATGPVSDAGPMVAADIGTTIAFSDAAEVLAAYHTSPLPAGEQATISAYVAMDDGAAPSFGSATVGAVANDFALALQGQVIDPLTYVVEALGDGIYRVSATATTGSHATVTGAVRYATNSLRTFRIGGWQVERGAVLTPYQRAADHWDVTEAGVRDCYYLLGDGVDDRLTGASLPLSDDYTMVAGLQGAASATSVNPMFGIVTGNNYLTIMSRRDPPARQLLARMRDISNDSPLIQASAGNGAFPHDTPLVPVLRKADGALEIQSSTGGIGVGTYEPSEFVGVAAIQTSSGGGSPTGHFSGLIINRDLTPAELQAVRTVIAYDAGATLEQIDE